jgi:hypothetical protein
MKLGIMNISHHGFNRPAVCKGDGTAYFPPIKRDNIHFSAFTGKCPCPDCSGRRANTGAETLREILAQEAARVSATPKFAGWAATPPPRHFERDI